MFKSKLGLDLDLSPIFIENGRDLNILKCGGLGLDLKFDLISFF